LIYLPIFDVRNTVSNTCLPIHNFPTLSFTPNTCPSSSSIFFSPETHIHEKLLYLNSLGIDFLTLFNCHPPSTHPLFPPSNPSSTTSPLHLSTSPYKTYATSSPCSASTPSSTSVTPSSSSPRMQRQYTAKTCALVPPGNWYPRYKLGLSCRRATPMFTRSTQLFNYSVAENYEPKVSYLVGEIGRDMREILESTQYFSFSLENWIKPRHEACLAKEVRFPLAVMMKTKEDGFRDALEVCSDSSPPSKTSGLICVQKDSLFLEFWLGQ
ncbi:hypothetical protein IGI04_010432, partial [Brassica rapa subsp. trilocularis]